MVELRRTFVLANEFKEGDLLVGGTADAAVRADAKRALAAVRIGEIVPAAFVDDGVTERSCLRCAKSSTPPPCRSAKWTW